MIKNSKSVLSATEQRQFDGILVPLKWTNAVNKTLSMLLPAEMAQIISIKLGKENNKVATAIPADGNLMIHC